MPKVSFSDSQFRILATDIDTALKKVKSKGPIDPQAVLKELCNTAMFYVSLDTLPPRARSHFATQVSEFEYRRGLSDAERAMLVDDCIAAVVACRRAYGVGV
jgi:hypothetical protein